VGTLRKVPAVLAVVVATLAAGLGALAVFSVDKHLSVATVRVSVSPLHDGALDIYVPVVDWGARFPNVRFPARLKVDVRAVNRREVTRLAQGVTLDVDDVRGEARDAIAGYIRALLLIVLLTGGAAGVVVAFAVRGHHAPRLRFTIGAAVATAAAATAILTVTLPPRGIIANPQYYAFGSDIPRALETLSTIQNSTDRLDQELSAQLVGVANLVVEPANRRPLGGSPSLVIASDLHNNFLTLPILERTARRRPVLFPGDVTDRGSRLETAIVQRIVHTGRPFVYVSGNHDSDMLDRRLARDGAIVLTQDGRLRADGKLGPVVQRVAGLRIAGYSDPFERRAADDFADRYKPDPGPENRAAFAGWLESLRGKVDVVMVHEPALITDALESLKKDPPTAPIVFVVGHTHRAALMREGLVTVINGGSVGGGGTGNLSEHTNVGLAIFTYDIKPRFWPLAADLVSVSPSTGSATARRERLDVPAPASGGS
jgi:predicted phosphodiesterase